MHELQHCRRVPSRAIQRAVGSCGCSRKLAFLRCCRRLADCHLSLHGDLQPGQAISEAQQRHHPRATYGTGKDSLSSSKLDCQHFELCSGCSLDNNLRTPPSLLRAQEYFRTLGIASLPVTFGPFRNWRLRARLAVRGTIQQPVIGLYAQGTHAAVDLHHCRIHHPQINAVVARVRAAMAALGTQPFSDADKDGELRYLQLTVAHADGGPDQDSDDALVQVVLVWNAASSNQRSMRRLHKLAGHLWKQDAALQAAGALPSLHSIWVNLQTSPGNVILSTEWQLLHGKAHLWQKVGSAEVCLHPGSFAQANAGAMTHALAAISSWVPPGSRVADLHAGVGTIGLSLLAQGMCSALRCVEINPAGKAAFQLALERLQLKLQGRQHCLQSESSPACLGTQSTMQADSRLPPAEYIVSSAGAQAAAALRDADVVVLDPPRKGLDEELLQALCTFDDVIDGLDSSSTRLNKPLLRPRGKLTSAVKPAGFQTSDKAEMSASSLSRSGQPARLSSQVIRHYDAGSHVDSKLQRIVYLSCALPALMRDCDMLVSSGRWQLVHAEVFGFFPGTDSLETLAIFDRPVSISVN